MVGGDSFTVGNDVVIRSDRRSLTPAAERHLLAHEIAHVVQQRRGPVDGEVGPDGVQSARATTASTRGGARGEAVHRTLRLTSCTKSTRAAYWRSRTARTFVLLSVAPLLYGNTHSLRWPAATGGAMSQYLSPGVYVREIPGVRPIEGVGTTVAAFVGVARGGPANEPKLITSWRQYGRPSVNGSATRSSRSCEGSFLAHSVYGFFMNGGSRCYVVNVGGAPPAAEGDAAAPADGDAATAADGGADGCLGRHGDPGRGPPRPRQRQRRSRQPAVSPHASVQPSWSAPRPTAPASVVSKPSTRSRWSASRT